MKKIVYLLILIVAGLGIYYFYQNKQQALQAKKASENWHTVSGSPTVSDLEKFINDFPNSKFISTARHMRDSLEMELAWEKTKNQNTIQSYLDFQAEYPESKYQSELQSILNKLRMEQAWEKAQNTNTLAGYQKFQTEYPESKYQSQVQQIIDKLSMEQAWEKAQKANTIDSYEKFQQEYPDSPYRQKAAKNIIDLNVDNIFAGQHGELPPPQKTSESSHSKINTIVIENATSFTLSVMYSGIESRKIAIEPENESTITLPNGSYKVAASVDSPNVMPFAGEQELNGGEYKSMFYIIGL